MKKETWFKVHVVASDHLRYFGLVVAVILLAGCSGNQAPQPGPIAGKVAIKGSNTVGEELAPHLISEYKRDRPEVTVELESKGTASGLEGLLSGSCDMAAASRVINRAELMQAQAKNIDLNAHNIGSYSVAVIVNGKNPVHDLTREQVRDIFIGKVQNWKEVGGPDSSVHPCARHSSSGTYLGFREMAMEDKDYGANTKTFTNYTGIAEAVAQDPAAVGYCCFNLLTNSGVKGISIHGVEPSVLSVSEGRYPYARVLRLYTNKAKESPAAIDFIHFVQSAKGQEIVAQNGYIPRP